MATLEFRAMNTAVLLAVKDNHSVSRGLMAVQEFILDSEQRFSRFIPESELCQLNNAAGGWFSVSWELMEMLELSHEYYAATRGLFDPSILPDLVRAGYNKSLDAITAAAARGAFAHVDQLEPFNGQQGQGRAYRPSFGQIELDSPRLRVRLPAGMAIDLGGIAKGWIVQKAATLLSSYAFPCAVSAGGDMFFVGEPEDGSRWRVELEDPLDSSRTLAWLSAGPGAVVTSSVTKRAWRRNSVTNHHIIDPRTGESAKTDWLSVTVFAADAAAAEAYAKALLIGGRDEAPGLQRGCEELAFVTVDEKRELSWSPNFKDFQNDTTAVRAYSEV